MYDQTSQVVFDRVDSWLEDTIYEGGDEFSEKQGIGSEKKGPTQAEKDDKEKQLEISTAYAKDLLFSYLKKYKAFLIIALVLNVLGMIGEFAAPLFIGWVIDAITNEDEAAVKKLVM